MGTYDELRGVESSIHLLRGVRMSRSDRERAVVDIRRSEALVELGFRAAAGITATLRRLAHRARAIASASP